MPIPSFNFGWVEDKGAVEKVLAAAEMPYLGACSHAIKDTGAGKKQLLYKLVEQLNGHYPNRHQGIGDCVSMMGAGAIDVLTCVEILMKGDLEEFEGLASTEFLYAGSRVTIGKGFYRDDGSNGGWLVEFMQKYGILLQKKYDDIDLTKYDPNRAREWGAPRVGPPQKLFKYSKEHCIQTYSQVTTAEEARDAIFNGFPVLVCSNQGFSDRRDSEGFARPQGTWPHALLVTAMDFEYKRPGFLIQNSWGEWNSGPTRHEQPVGSFWCDADVFEKHMLRANDSWVISNYKGYPKRDIQWGNLFR